MYIFNLNYFNIILSSLIGMVIAAFWYSPSGFGKKWMELTNLKEKDIKAAQKNGMTANYAAAFAALIIMNYALSFITENMLINSIQESVFLGLLIWLGFIATTMLNMILWEFKSVELYTINASHYLVVLIVSAVIVGL